MTLKELTFLKVVRQQADEAHCLCPFHDDNRASLSINTAKGLWHCFGCQKAGTIDELAYTYNALIDNKNLLKNETILNQLSKRLITKDIIKKYKLGYSEISKRISIPYFRTNDVCYGIKYHLIDKHKREAGDEKVFTNGKVPDLYPYWLFDKNEKEVILTEGEFDCILARELYNLNAYTFGPVGYFDNKYLKDFREKIVTVVYDNDTAGISGADKLIEKIQAITKQTRRCLLQDKKGNPIKDITEFLLSNNKNLDELIKSAPTYKIENESRIIEIRADYISDEIQSIDFQDSARADNHGKLIMVSGLVAGKDTQPFLVPTSVTMTCLSRKKSKNCTGCILFDSSITIKINKLSRSIMQLVLATDNQQRYILREVAGVPKCAEIEIKNNEMTNVEDLRIIPKSPADRYLGYSTRQLFYINNKFLESNVSYIFKGVIVPEPRLQYAVVLSDQTEIDQNDIDLFKLSESETKELRKFVNKNDGFNGLVDLAEKITMVYFRKLMFGIILLTYTSVLKFDMFGKKHRGYISSLIIGDTRTGKSEAIEKFFEAVKLGEVIVGEASSIAGILGGCKQYNGRWIVSWGKLIINHRGFIAIDEGDGLSQEDYSKLSSVRSKGQAQITKIHQEIALAETRLVVLANPRADKHIKDFPYGVMAIKDLIGKPEDIARFDLFCGLRIDSVNGKQLLNKMEKVPKVSDDDVNMLKKLILFAWTRKKSDIEFSKEAIEKLKSTIISFKYSSDIPLIEQNEGIFKLARISISMAILNGHFTDDGKVTITEKDIIDVEKFIKSCYEDAGLNYSEFSLTFESLGIKNPKKIEDRLKLLGNDFIEGLIRTNQLSFSDIEDYSGLNRDDARQLLSDLVRARCLTKKYTYYEKSAEFILMLKKLYYKKGEE